MAMKTIIGQAARGKDFFPRPQITKDIWTKLKAGSNLLIVAPRRVGKSSVLFHLLDNPQKNNIVIYYTSESVNSENEFYKKLFNHIIERIKKIKKYKAKFSKIAKELLHSIDSIGKDGITFRSDSTISYYQEFLKLITNLDFESEKIVVLIDEFAQTVENIIRDENESSAIHFLETKREIRQIPEIHKKLQFIYSGSIGLENIVSRLNVINLINDLTAIRIPALNQAEAENLIRKILGGTGIILDKEALDHLLGKIEWWIPYYFQLILDEADKILITEKTALITKSIIDRAVENALSERIYFEHWLARLRTAFKSEEFSFVKELLNLVSEQQEIPSEIIFDLAMKYKLENSYHDLVNTLKHDGYINNHDDPKVYRFNSPLLRVWWYRNVAN